ncbi:hypothetical protein GQ54DRAFT_295530 [Martensiomyces pterosporus]|nr:hypothetical protein GQ54DRAFT_295530 [Martensiomyces pterosporus]
MPTPPPQSDQESDHCLSQQSLSDNETETGGSSSGDEHMFPWPAIDGAPDTKSHIEILGMQSRSQCGYCKAKSGSRFLAVRSRKLMCQDYQALVDRGWRRSGTLLYLTDHSDSCCAYYTIRTHAMEHSLGSSDKKLLRKLRRYFPSGAAAPGGDEYIGKVCAIDSVEGPRSTGEERRLEVRLEKATFSEAKYRVFEKYQAAVHDDHESTRSKFRSFLCASPLVFQQPSSSPATRSSEQDTSSAHLPHGLGSYHQCYYVNGQLAAVGVLDILPKCVSSVYLFYDPEYSHLSLGSYSALREIALVRGLHQKTPEIAYYYMGYFIPSCPKMTYKAHWRPADLLDFITFKWIPIERCLERIQKHAVFCTFDPAVDHMNLVRNRIEDRLEIAPAMAPELLTEKEKERALGLVMWMSGTGRGRVFPVLAADVARLSEDIERLVLQLYASFGDKLISSVLLRL